VNDERGREKRERERGEREREREEKTRKKEKGYMWILDARHTR